MKILIGTTNPAKAAVFAKQLEGYDAELLTLPDLGIQKHPDEDGKDPMENAMIKAAYYGQFHDPVITEDSALYIKELPMDDPRQPGLFVRRAPDGHEMTDGEMTAHYAALARSLGGRCTAYWLDGYAVCKDGIVTGFMNDCEEVNRAYAFYLVDTPHPEAQDGWPIDRISVDIRTGRYLTDRAWGGSADAKEKTVILSYEKKLNEFYIQALGLSEKA